MVAFPFGKISMEKNMLKLVKQPLTSHIFQPSEKKIHQDGSKRSTCVRVGQEGVWNYLKGIIVVNSLHKILDCCWKYFLECCSVQHGELEVNRFRKIIDKKSTKKNKQKVEEMILNPDNQPGRQRKISEIHGKCG